MRPFTIWTLHFFSLSVHLIENNREQPYSDNSISNSDKNLSWFILTDESVFMPETCGPGCETHFPKLISLKSSCLYFCYSQFRIYNAINPNSKWNWLLLYLNYLSSAQNRDLRPSLELWRLVHVLCWSLLDLHLIIIWSIKYGLRRYHYMAKTSSSIEFISTEFWSNSL